MNQTTTSSTGVALPDPSTKSYAYTVNISWGVTIVLLVAVVLTSLWRSAKVKRMLDEAEARREGRKNG
ncbi:heme exporter protein CcmD [Thioclava atlantica]|uniref:Heme exporter protein D n=1 Tax=Thioclava atlantica TaxID=1317124 RepID=A0A085TXC1_9RHOB|nr:heme exporter protein CcmD [Thioclava atlantica]KFE35368.1 hypothetical protein DW2_08062 [Thioclava atlantica]